jgi:hypothetical protein
MFIQPEETLLVVVRELVGKPQFLRLVEVVLM